MCQCRVTLASGPGPRVPCLGSRAPWPLGPGPGLQLRALGQWAPGPLGPGPRAMGPATHSRGWGDGEDLYPPSGSVNSDATLFLFWSAISLVRLVSSLLLVKSPPSDISNTYRTSLKVDKEFEGTLSIYFQFEI